MRYTESACIEDFENHLLQGSVFGQQNVFSAFAHALDMVIREMSVSFWYSDQIRPTNPDPTGWIAFQMVQPNLVNSVVRPYPDGYTVLAETVRLNFTDIVEHQVIRARGQGGTIKYLEPLFVVSQGFRSDNGGDAVWEGLEAVTITLNYQEAE